MATNFDEALKKAGGFGRFQAFLFCFMSITGISVAFHNLVHVFTGVLPPHVCDTDIMLNISSESNYSAMMMVDKDVIANQSSELQNKSTYETASSLILKENWYYLESCGTVTNLSVTLWTEFNTTNTSETPSTIRCNDWKFDKSTYDSTVGTEAWFRIVSVWSLVCEKQWLLPFIQSLHMIGCLVGSLSGGIISDKFGRRTTIVAAVIVEALTGIVAAFSPNLIVYGLLRFMVGVSIAALYNAVVILGIELVQPGLRLLVAAGLLYMNALGIMVLALLGFFIRSWRSLQLVTSAFLAVQLIYIWIVPESPRWLLVKEKYNQAIRIFKKISRYNQKEWPNDVKLAKPLSTVHTESTFDLIRTMKLRSRTIKISFVWLVVSVVYYGLSLYTSELDGDNFRNLFLSGLVEVPALTVAIFAGKRFGRRVLLAGPLSFAGACLLLTSPVPDSLSWVRVALAMAGKLGMTTAFATIYPFTVELFPTSVRSAGLGFTSMCARIGGLVAPFIVLLNSYGRVVPMVVCGGLAFIACSLVLLLPETYKLSLTETVEDAVNQETEESVFSNCSCYCYRTKSKNVPVEVSLIRPLSPGGEVIGAIPVSAKATLTHDVCEHDNTQEIHLLEKCSINE